VYCICDQCLAGALLVATFEDPLEWGFEGGSRHPRCHCLQTCRDLSICNARLHIKCSSTRHSRFFTVLEQVLPSLTPLSTILRSSSSPFLRFSFISSITSLAWRQNFSPCIFSQWQVSRLSEPVRLQTPIARFAGTADRPRNRETSTFDLSSRQRGAMRRKPT